MWGKVDIPVVDSLYLNKTEIPLIYPVIRAKWVIKDYKHVMTDFRDFYE